MLQTFGRPLALVPMTFSQSSYVFSGTCFSICTSALFTRISNNEIFSLSLSVRENHVHPN